MFLNRGPPGPPEGNGRLGGVHGGKRGNWGVINSGGVMKFSVSKVYINLMKQNLLFHKDYQVLFHV